MRLLGSLIVMWWSKVGPAWRRWRWCRRGLHRESDWILSGSYRSIYCLDCEKHLVLRRRDGPYDQGDRRGGAGPLTDDEAKRYL